MTEPKNLNQLDKCIQVFSRGAQGATQIAISVSLLINLAALMATLSAMSSFAVPPAWQALVAQYSPNPNPAIGFYFIAVIFFVLGIIAAIISQCLVFVAHSNLLKLINNTTDTDMETEKENIFKTLNSSPFILISLSYVFFLLGGFIVLCRVIYRILTIHGTM